MSHARVFMFFMAWFDKSKFSRDFWEISRFYLKLQRVLFPQTGTAKRMFHLWHDVFSWYGCFYFGFGLLNILREFFLSIYKNYETVFFHNFLKVLREFRLYVPYKSCIWSWWVFLKVTGLNEFWRMSHTIQAGVNQGRAVKASMYNAW